MRPAWMDPDVPGPTALCVTTRAAREAHQWASDVPGGPAARAVVNAYDEARFWCNRCPVRDACLTFALAAEGKDDHRARDSVYGGLDPVQRATLAGRPPKQRPKARPRDEALHTCAYAGCGDQFQRHSALQRYCGRACQNSADRERRKAREQVAA